MHRQVARSEQRRWLSGPNPRGTVIALVCVAAFVSRAGVNAEQASELQDSSIFEQSQYSVTIVVCVSAVAFLLIAVYVLASCTDCYKSEVSTDFHPATGQTERKWGGAGGYTSVTADNVNDSVLGAGFTGEVVMPGQGSDQALPYTMIPSQLPEAQGFRGYGSAPPEQGLRGYGGGNEGQSTAGYGGAGAQRLPGAHMIPVNEPEEPPPSYFSATKLIVAGSDDTFLQKQLHRPGFVNRFCRLMNYLSAWASFFVFFFSLSFSPPEVHGSVEHVDYSKPLIPKHNFVH